MDNGNFLLGHRIDIFQEVRCLTAHHHQFIGQIGQLAHDLTIFRRGVLQNRV